MSGTKSFSLTEEKSRLYAKLVALYARSGALAELAWVLDSMGKDLKRGATEILGTSEIKHAMMDALQPQVALRRC